MVLVSRISIAFLLKRLRLQFWCQLITQLDTLVICAILTSPSSMFENHRFFFVFGNNYLWGSFFLSKTWRMQVSIHNEETISIPSFLNKSLKLCILLLLHILLTHYVCKNTAVDNLLVSTSTCMSHLSLL